MSRRPARIALVGAWALTAAGGAAALFFTPNTIVSELGLAITWAWASVTLTAATIGALGALWGRYRLEWVASWFVALGLLPYCATVWWLVSQGESGRLTQGLLILALMSFTMRRGFECAAKAAELRELKESGDDA